MALKKWSPKNEVARMMDEFFESPFLPKLKETFPFFRKFEEHGLMYPSVDMFEKNNEIVVKADIPGVDKDDISISIANNVLTIKGETKKEEEVKENDYYYSERSRGEFVRRLQIPEGVQENKVTADFKEGILEIHMPKSAKSKPKEIKIKTK